MLSKLLAAALAATLLAAFSSAPALAYPAPAPVTGDQMTHDPSMVFQPGTSRSTVFSTNDLMRSSTDLSAFTWGSGPPLPSTPSWWRTYNPAGQSWAPDVSFRNGQYWMYYAVSTFGSQKSAIGLATSPTGAAGTFTDRGIVLTSAAGKAYNAIDPALLVDASGRWWLTFGSFWKGIYQFELNPATGKARQSSPKLIHLAQRSGANGSIEGPYVVAHGGYYYLFASFDYCCRGVDSTYNIRVGRSRSPNGPFVDAAGQNMLNGGGTLLLASHDRVVGPGGQSVVRDEAGGRDLLVYHYYDGLNAGEARLGINVLGWTAAGWPAVS
jgi:arabinan endo-1,5-alpha-L-arabinosidase